MELEATSKTLLPTTGPRKEAAMISAGTLDNLQVNNLVLFESNMKHIFANKVQSFRGGQLTHFLGKWKELIYQANETSLCHPSTAWPLIVRLHR